MNHHSMYARKDQDSREMDGETMLDTVVQAEPIGKVL